MSTEICPRGNWLRVNNATTTNTDRPAMIPFRLMYVRVNRQTLGILDDDRQDTWYVCVVVVMSCPGLDQQPILLLL